MLGIVLVVGVVEVGKHKGIYLEELEVEAKGGEGETGFFEWISCFIKYYMAGNEDPPNRA